jgi:hypothetical protein
MPAPAITRSARSAAPRSWPNSAGSGCPQRSHIAPTGLSPHRATLTGSAPRRTHARRGARREHGKALGRYARRSRLHATVSDLRGRSTARDRLFLRGVFGYSSLRSQARIPDSPNPVEPARVPSHRSGERAPPVWGRSFWATWVSRRVGGRQRLTRNFLRSAWHHQPGPYRPEFGSKRRATILRARQRVTWFTERGIELPGSVAQLYGMARPSAVMCCLGRNDGGWGPTVRDCVILCAGEHSAPLRFAVRFMKGA